MGEYQAKIIRELEHLNAELRTRLTAANAEIERLRELVGTADDDARCREIGHSIIDDHCGKPEHRYCWRCGEKESTIFLESP